MSGEQEAHVGVSRRRWDAGMRYAFLFMGLLAACRFLYVLGGGGASTAAVVKSPPVQAQAGSTSSKEAPRPTAVYGMRSQTIDLPKGEWSGPYEIPPGHCVRLQDAPGIDLRVRPANSQSYVEWSKIKDQVDRGINAVQVRAAQGARVTLEWPWASQCDYVKGVTTVRNDSLAVVSKKIETASVPPRLPTAIRLDLPKGAWVELPQVPMGHCIMWATDQPSVPNDLFVQAKINTGAYQDWAQAKLTGRGFDTFRFKSNGAKWVRVEYKPGGSCT